MCAAQLPVAGVWGGKKVVREVLPFTPPSIRKMLDSLPDSIWERAEEIRIRQGKPLLLSLDSGDIFVTPSGGCTSEASAAYTVTPSDMERLLQLITGSSLYAVEEELKSGFITLPGGHRVGLAGRAVVEDGRVKTLKQISFCNIRICREVRGAAAKVLPQIIDRKNGTIYHTMLVSPPRGGKTTLLRDLVRMISNGFPELGLPGQTVGLVDERSEIAGCYRGVPQLDVGVRTDVLDACPKAQGMMMLLRSMGPKVIAADEIGKAEEVEVLEEVLCAGVKVLITAHGSSLAEISQRPALGRLVRQGAIERYVILGRRCGAGTVEGVFDGRNFASAGVKVC